MESAALNRPPERLERIVLLLTPPAAREAVVGDLCETFSTPLHYAREALRTLPLVILSQMRRNANLPALGLQGFLIFLCCGGFGGDVRASQILAPLLAVLALLLRDAYQPIGRPTARRAILEAVAVAYGVLIFSQLVTTGMVVPKPLVPDLLLWMRFGILAPMMLPLLCLVRTGLIIQSDASRPFPSDDLSLVDMRRDYRHFETRIRRRNRVEAGALGLAAVTAAFYVHPGQSGLGLGLMSVYVLVAFYLLVEGGAQAISGDADFVSLRALYQRELARQQQLRRFLVWLWLAPVLMALHARLIAGGLAAERPILIVLGSAALLMLCFVVSALNREYGGWVQEKIGLLDRIREKNA